MTTTTYSNAAQAFVGRRKQRHSSNRHQADVDIFERRIIWCLETAFCDPLRLYGCGSRQNSQCLDEYAEISRQQPAMKSGDNFNEQQQHRASQHQASPSIEKHLLRQAAKDNHHHEDDKMTVALNLVTDIENNQQHLDATQRQQLLHNQSRTNVQYQGKEFNQQNQSYHGSQHRSNVYGEYQSQPSRNVTHGRHQQTLHPRSYSLTANLPRNLLLLIIVNSMLNHLTQLIQPGSTNNVQLFAYPNTVQADSVNECSYEQDCDHPDKTCFDNKCICKRAKPIEYKEQHICLPHAIQNEPCILSEQCLGGAICSESFCVCGSDTISILNPSTKVYYCHPKRRLNEECNYDNQCPENAFCSTEKHGCLCQNGFGESVVRNSNGIEQSSCLPKLCHSSKDCESEYHVCDDNKCLCLATHFDPHTARCYKFAATKADEPQVNGNTTILSDNDQGGSTSFINDLMSNGDKLWLIVIILTLFTVIFLAILIFVLRKYYVGYCWTHTKEYEPHNDNNSPRNFDKNSINNKSFRKKSADLEECDVFGNGASHHDTAADKSTLAKSANKKNSKSASRNGYDKINENHYVEVDMRCDAKDNDDRQLASPNGRTHHQVVASRPLPSSHSTPV